MNVDRAVSANEPIHVRPVLTVAVKLVLDDAFLPDPDALCGDIGRAHASQRCVAIHCVTRAELALALRCLEDVGVRDGDRIEHAGIAPPELAAWMADLGVYAVTQPHFIFERGDRYLREVEARDQPWLYRAAGLQRAGVRIAGGSDAPFGEPDPWAAMRAAVDRRSEAGVVLGEAEALSPESALALFGGDAARPGQSSPALQRGEPADLCLLDRRWSRARDTLSAEFVRACWCGGALQWDRDAR